MAGMNPYPHRVCYHETDQMGIVHHSNYIKWMEEARIDYLDQIGVSYKAMEAAGIMIPVLSVSVDYLRMLRFEDNVIIETKVKEYNGIKMTVAYEMINTENGKVCCRGISKHCFLSKEGQPLALKRTCPNVHELFLWRLKEDKKKEK